MKTRLLAFLLATIMTVSLFAMTTFAANDERPTDRASGEAIVTRAEEVTWYYRNYNGHVQKRLWSNTYGYWLTDWINVD